MLAVVLVRGLMGVRQDAKDTLFMLHLRRKHNCVIVQDNPTNRGMLNKVKNYVAYGIIDAETLGLLREKRPISSKAKSRSRYAHTLHPPRGGFEREGIKKSYTKGGVLGDRKDKINALIRKML
ncbi:uL30 family ribosomal protein [Candidatus Woesearchaeota archaeon]|nr:uL30 family ribosomal protein [Candidatus Woesearchaeota archaeon]